MKKSVFQKVLVVTCLMFSVMYLAVTCEARSEKGEGTVQLRQGEGRIGKVNTEGVTVDDLYFRFFEGTRYVDSKNQYTQQSSLVTGMYVSYIINIDETVRRIQSVDKAVSEEETNVDQGAQTPSGGEELYQEGGVWKN